MTTASFDRSLDADAALLVEQMIERLQSGESNVEELIAAHPEHAETLRRLAPVAQVMASLSEIVGSDPERNSDSSVILHPSSFPEGTLGDFRLIREVGRGGMGIVYEAEQISLRRRVALKVLPFAGTLDPRHLQRFRNEAQAAAHLHHTNIVPVYFVGTERGVHFYAMQFIEGQTLADVIGEIREEKNLNHRDTENTEKKRQNEPNHGGTENTEKKKEDDLNHRGTEDTEKKEKTGLVSSLCSLCLGGKQSSYFRQITELGIQAAEALDHAHEQGIVHRDIKPANLLLSPLPASGRGDGGEGAGHLWITDFGLAHCQSDAALTMSGDLIGTLRYMSPEQALAKRVPIDHRTDIYSLGATLYELLTLHPVIDGADRSEILRKLTLEEPKPLRKWNKSIPPELETIVLKALEKSPESRYATAKELADDLRRWTMHEPIKARPPGWREKAAKWGRRHRGSVRAAVAMLVLAVVGLSVSTWLIWREKETARIAKVDAKLAEGDARDQAELTRAINEFLQKDLLAQASSLEQGNAGFKPDPNLTVRDALHRAASRIGRFKDKPLVEAGIRSAIGEALSELDVTNEAIEHLSRAVEIRKQLLGPDHTQTLHSMHMLGEAYVRLDRFDDAIRFLDEVRVRRMRTETPISLEGLTVTSDLAVAYQEAGRLEDALGLLEFVREQLTSRFGLENQFTLTAMNNLARVYRDLGRLPDAISLLEECRKHLPRVNGADHPLTLLNLTNLANIYKGTGRAEEAISLLREAHQRTSNALGPTHSQTLWTLATLGETYRVSGRTVDAIETLELAHGDQCKTLGPDHEETLTTLNNLACAYTTKGDFSKAIERFETVQNARAAQFGANNPRTLGATRNLATCLLKNKQYEQAAAKFTVVIESGKADNPPNPLKLAETMNQLADCLQALGRHVESVRILRECLTIRQKHAPKHWTAFATMARLGRSLIAESQFHDAESLLLNGFNGLNAQAAQLPPLGQAFLRETIEQLIQLYDATSQPDKAAEWRRTLEAERAANATKKNQ